ncbi:putative uncharacterized protein [Clostridium sp. CAG:440]|nr:putative uncharacterized protein [Clostridium sp. CAG:440]
MNIEKVNNQEYKAAIYIRLSKEDGDREESESVVNQRKILKAYAKENKYKIYGEYIDDGYTGTNFNRPDFKRMINDIENKRINMVITKSLSRLGRDYIETGRYIETYFPEKEIRYIAILDDVDTFLDKNCDTVAFKNIMNDYYAKETSKNIKKTKNKKKLEGFYYTSYAPFGYKKVSKSGNLEIDEVQAEIVRRIFDLFSEGYGTYQIARILTDEKVETPGLQMKMTCVVNNITNTTDKWNHNTIRRMLENQIYIGNCVQNKTKKISYKSKKMIRLPKEEHSIIRNHHTPIISKEKWDIVQKMLKNHQNAKVRETDVMFKGLLYCSHCNNKLSIRTKVDHNKSGDVTRRYILCNNATKKYTNKPCYKRYINYDTFEEKAISKITDTLELYINSKAFKDEEVLRKILDAQSNKGSIEKKKEKLEKDLENVNKKITTLYNDKLNGLLEEQDFKLFSEGLVNERHRIEKILNETQKELESFQEDTNNNRIKSDMQKIIKKILKSKEYTKEIINQLVNRIEVDKDNHAIIYFNFYELNCIGGEVDVKQASGL